MFERFDCGHMLAELQLPELIKNLGTGIYIKLEFCSRPCTDYEGVPFKSGPYFFNSAFAKAKVKNFQNGIFSDGCLKKKQNRRKRKRESETYRPLSEKGPAPTTALRRGEI